MQILNISTFDKSTHKPTVLYPFGSYASIFAWGTTISTYWEVQPIIDNAFNAGKIRTDKPIICHEENGKFHYLLEDEETKQILHFATDEKLKDNTSNIVFTSIKNYLTLKTMTIDEFVPSLNEVLRVNEALQPPKENPIVNVSTTTAAMKILKTSPVLKRPEPIHTESLLSEPKKHAEPKVTFLTNTKAPHETHESFLDRIIKFFSYFLCCLRHDADDEPAPHANNEAAAPKRRL